MEIDITTLARDCDPADYSASRAELGDNAGKITWSNALAARIAFFRRPNTSRRCAAMSKTLAPGRRRRSPVGMTRNAMPCLCSSRAATYVRLPGLRRRARMRKVLIGKPMRSWPKRGRAAAISTKVVMIEFIIRFVTEG